MAKKKTEETSDENTETPEAAAAIADCILDDSAPLRSACDPMGDGLLTSWRTSTDEEMMSGMLTLFGGK